jgi:hypothetical protein
VVVNWIILPERIFEECFMRVMAKTIVVVGMLAGLSACQHQPEGYYQQQGPVDSLSPDDRGLQSKNLVEATDQMTRDLLATPDLRNSPTKWVLVIDRTEDRTVERYFNTNYDIFLERLRGCLAKYGNNQIALAENRAKLDALRNRELDAGDQAAAMPNQRMLPQYAMYAKAMDLPNRSTNYYLIEFTVIDMKSGIQVWTRTYEVKTAR